MHRSLFPSPLYLSPFLHLFLGQSPGSSLPGPHSSINPGEGESKKELAGSVPTTQDEDLEKIRENNNNQCGGGEEEAAQQPEDQHQLSPPKNQAWMSTQRQQQQQQQNRFLFPPKIPDMDEYTTITTTKTGFNSRLKTQAWMSTQQQKPVFIPA
jgi:hypothetical protein